MKDKNLKENKFLNLMKLNQVKLIQVYKVQGIDLIV